MTEPITEEPPRQPSPGEQVEPKDEREAVDILKSHHQTSDFFVQKAQAEGKNPGELLKLIREKVGDCVREEAGEFLKTHFEKLKDSRFEGKPREKAEAMAEVAAETEYVKARGPLLYTAASLVGSEQPGRFAGEVLAHVYLKDYNYTDREEAVLREINHLAARVLESHDSQLLAPKAEERAGLFYRKVKDYIEATERKEETSKQ